MKLDWFRVFLAVTVAGGLSWGGYRLYQHLNPVSVSPPATTAQTQVPKVEKKKAVPKKQVKPGQTQRSDRSIQKECTRLRNLASKFRTGEWIYTEEQKRVRDRYYRWYNKNCR